MKAFFSIYKNSRIVRDIISKIVIIELVSFLVLMSMVVFLLQPVLNQQTEELAYDMNTYMSGIINSAFESMMTASRYMASSAQLQRDVKKYDSEMTDEAFKVVQLSLNQLVSCQTLIRGVILDKPGQFRFDSITSISDRDHDALNGAWYKALESTDYGQVFFVSEEESLTFIFSRNVNFGLDRYIISVLYSADTMFDDITRYSKSMFSGFALVDRDQNILHMSGEKTVFSDLPQNISGKIIPSGDGVFFVSTIRSNMWKLISYARNDVIRIRYGSYLTMTTLLFILQCIITVLLVTSIVYRKIKPINTLSSAMGKAAEGYLDPIPEINTNNEIGDLSRIFNYMTGSLNTYFNTILEHEKTEQRMRYNLLISQIDPHFIYNTMNIINILARDNRTDDIVKINTALIRIMQDRLRLSDIQVFDTVSLEVDIVKEYLLIQKYRFLNFVSVAWLIDEAISGKRIPKNIIQPLVENALFHGLFNESEGMLKGSLSIEITSENEYFIIRVSDSGRGIEPDKIQKIIDSFTESEEIRGRHIGLKNIYGRLKYLFGEDCYMHIDGSKGAVVTIGIKMDKLSNEEDTQAESS